MQIAYQQNLIQEHLVDLLLKKLKSIQQNSGVNANTIKMMHLQYQILKLESTNPHWIASELKALLEQDLVLTSYDNRNDNLEHLSKEKQERAIKGLQTELAFISEAEGMTEVLVNQAAQAFMGVFPLKETAEEKDADDEEKVQSPDHQVSESDTVIQKIKKMKQGNEAALKVNPTQLLTTSFDDLYNPLGLIGAEEYEEAQEAFRSVRKSKVYAVVVSEETNLSIDREKSKNASQTQILAKRKSTAEAIVTVIKTIEHHYMLTSVPQMNAHRARYAQKVARRMFPIVTRTTAGQASLHKNRNAAIKRLKEPLIEAATRARPKSPPGRDAPVEVSWGKLLEACSGGMANEETVKGLAKVLRDIVVDVRCNDNTGQLETIIEVGYALERILQADSKLAQHLDFNFKDAATPEVIAWQFVLHILQKIADKVVTTIIMHYSNVPNGVFNATKQIKQAFDNEDLKRTIAAKTFEDAESIIKVVESYGDSMISLAAKIDTQFTTAAFTHPALNEKADPLLKVAKKRRRNRDTDSKEDDTKSTKQKPRKEKKRGRAHCLKFYRGQCAREGQCPNDRAHHGVSSKSAKVFATTSECPADIKALIDEATTKKVAFSAFAANCKQCPYWLRRGYCKYQASGTCKVGGDEAHKPEYKAKLKNPKTSHPGNGRDRRGSSSSSSSSSRVPVPRVKYPTKNGCYVRARGLQCPDPCPSGRSHAADAVAEATAFLKSTRKHTCKYDENCRYSDCRLYHPYSRDGTNAAPKRMMALASGVGKLTVDSKEEPTTALFHNVVEAANHYKSNLLPPNSTSTERMLVALGVGAKPVYHADKATGQIYEISAKPVGQAPSPEKESSRFRY